MGTHALTRLLCETCYGIGTVDRTIGGDGFGGRCCGTADVPTTCYDCAGTGIEQARYRGVRLYPEYGGWTIGESREHYQTLAHACGRIDDELDYPEPPAGMGEAERRATW